MYNGMPYWRLSGFYFFYFATLGGFLPYWGLYLESEGFSPSEIGQLMALLVGTKIVAPNIWGWIADHTGKSITIIRIATFLSAVVFAAVWAGQEFWWLACVITVFSFFWNAALPQMEAVTLSHLHQNSHHYSRIRSWGSIGFIVTVLSVGWALDTVDIKNLPILIVGLLTGIWLASQLIPEPNIAGKVDGQISVGSILRRPHVIAFFIVAMLNQMAHGPYYVFFSIYLGQHGYSGMATGMLWSLGVFAEVLIFAFMHAILKRFSLKTILLFSMLAGVVRWLLIGFVVDSFAGVIAAQLLHAATFGSAHVASIHLVHRFFKGRHLGKGQALYSSVSFGVGGAVGSLSSGELWSNPGPEVVYAVASLTCLVAFLIVLFLVQEDEAGAAG
ncbi:MAG: MFS transporter [Methylococcales bacterium]